MRVLPDGSFAAGVGTSTADTILVGSSLYGQVRRYNKLPVADLSPKCRCDYATY